MNLCECNCGAFVNKRFVKGHWQRITTSWNKGLTKETNVSIARVAEQKRGKKASLATRQKQGDAHRGKPVWNKGLTGKTDSRLNYTPPSEEEKNSWANICQCGICGQKCKNRFVNGHARKGVSMSEKSKQLLSDANLGKTISPETVLKMSIAASGENNSFYGKHHTDESIAKIMSHGWKKFLYIFPNGLEKKMRSSWEVLYAEFMDSLNIKWIYEPKQFKLSNGKRYWPDFYLPELNEYHEIKGYLHEDAKIKIELFQKEYPNFGFKLIRKSEMQVLGLL